MSDLEGHGHKATVYKDMYAIPPTLSSKASISLDQCYLTANEPTCLPTVFMPFVWPLDMVAAWTSSTCTPSQSKIYNSDTSSTTASSQSEIYSSGYEYDANSKSSSREPSRPSSPESGNLSAKTLYSPSQKWPLCTEGCMIPSTQ